MAIVLGQVRDERASSTVHRFVQVEPDPDGQTVQYIDCQWEAERRISTGREETVGFVGNSQDAIDVACSLLHSAVKRGLPPTQSRSPSDLRGILHNRDLCNVQGRSL